MRLDKFKCPECEAKRGVEISYGLPEWIETDKRKGVRLQAGCVILIGASPDFQCQRCGHRWRKDNGYQARVTTKRKLDITTNYDKAVRSYNARFDNAMIPSGPDSSGNERRFAGKDYVVLDNYHGLLAAFEISPTRLRYVEDLPEGAKAEWGYGESVED